jgi:hypothetical protein
MPLPIGDVLGILTDNLKKRKGVVPLSGKKIAAWAQGMDIPVGGETVLYTGQMYQLIPAINTMAAQMARFENSWITGFFGTGRILNKAINLSWFMSHSDPREQKAYNGLLRNVAFLLKTAGVEFGYLYEQELYSGALLYDQGVEDMAAEQARRVYALMRKSGVKRTITVDPHTTNMLRTVYPTIINKYDLEVKSYLEVLAERDPDPARRLDLDLVIHDSCVYARHEMMVEEPRKLLRKAGVRLHEPELSGRLTHCCGGPLESLFPSKSHEIAKKRAEQLASCGDRVATMCPICMANLKRAAGPRLGVCDISEYLVHAYCG